jgi:hypothetical protein
MESNVISFPGCECLLCSKDKQNKCYEIMLSTHGEVSACSKIYKAFKK